MPAYGQVDIDVSTGTGRGINATTVRLNWDAAHPSAMLPPKPVYDGFPVGSEPRSLGSGASSILPQGILTESESRRS